MRVLKFGGTSLEDASCLRRVARIVLSGTGPPPLVVVSAMGETTDRLVRIFDQAARGRQAEVQAEILRLRRETLARAREFLDLGTRARVGGLFRRLRELGQQCGRRRSASPRARDLFIAHGELISAVVVAAALRKAGGAVAVFDIRRVLITDGEAGRARPQDEAIRRRAARLLVPLLQRQIVVTQGFIGSTARGVTTTLGRGGSDYSASLLGAALAAEAIEIWTDVDGLMSADPRVVPNPRRLPAASFSDAAELARFGAGVLHPATLAPASAGEIPVWIKNSRNPGCPGTLLTSSKAPSPAWSIAFKTGLSLVEAPPARAGGTVGGLSRLAVALVREGGDLALLSASAVSARIAVESSVLTASLRADRRLSIRDGLAAVCVVGADVLRSPRRAGIILQAVGARLWMLSPGSGNDSLCLLVEEGHAPAVVRCLHAAMCREEDALEGRRTGDPPGHRGKIHRVVGDADRAVAG